MQVEVPKLSPPATVQIIDNTVPIEISEYAGYAGLIAANGGLEPNENSVFFKQYGFKVKLTVSEGENWSALNEGKLAASVTTADVLAVYGPQFHVVVPAQIGFSRGADGLVVRSDIKRINALKGKVIATAQFTEVDFFIRYLAQEAGLGINAIGSVDATPNPDRINLIYTEDGFAAGDLFLSDLKSGKNRIAGAVTWEPKMSEIVEQSGGKAHLLTTNKNLLIVADVLVVHQGFAEQQPEDGRRPRPRTARGQPDGPRHTRCLSRRHRSRVQVVARPRRRRSSPACTCRTCPRTSRSSRERSTRRAASKASTSRRCMPTAA